MRDVNKGFTLIELMIAVAIIAALVAVGVPQYQNYVARSQAIEGVNLAGGIKTALAEYYNTNGAFPKDTTDPHVGLGLEPATVYMAAFKDKEGFGADLKDAREHGQHALADMMLDLPYDKTMSASDKRLAFDAAKYLTKTRNRAEYGDKVELSGQIDTNVALPNWAFGQVIDATPQPEQLTDQSLDTGVPLDVDVVEEQPAHKPK